jgi:1,2-phenylacetyl-CoA epoxidase catalytic subunit
MNAIEDKEEWEETIERLVGIYRVLKPHLISHYSAHVATTNPVYEPPTTRILQRLVEEEKLHVERGQVLLNDLLDTREKHHRAMEWQGHLEELLAAAGGVTGFPASEDEIEQRKVGRS